MDKTFVIFNTKELYPNLYCLEHQFKLRLCSKNCVFSAPPDCTHKQIIKALTYFYRWFVFVAPQVKSSLVDEHALEYVNKVIKNNYKGK